MSQLMVSHGRVTHAVDAECAACAQVKAEFEKAQSDANENMFGREIKTPCYISFYTAKGAALRETMYSERNHMDAWLHRSANKRAKELGAHHWAVFKHWTGFDVHYTRDELEAIE